MSPTDLIAQLADHGIAAHADGDRIRLDAPVGVLTPDLLAAVRNCKGGLLNLLREPVPGLGESHADREFRRFAATAQPMPDGAGWFDPAFGSPVMPSGCPWHLLRRSEEASRIKPCGASRRRTKQ